VPDSLPCGFTVIDADVEPVWLKREQVGPADV
jgi:hypothetical protein